MNENILNIIKDIIQTSKRNFNENIDLSINLKDLDLSNQKNRINIEILLPNGRGKNTKICIFATGELAIKSKDIADIVIGSEEIDKLSEDKKKFKKLVNEHDFEAPI